MGDKKGHLLRPTQVKCSHKTESLENAQLNFGNWAAFLLTTVHLQMSIAPSLCQLACPHETPQQICSPTAWTYCSANQQRDSAWNSK